MSSRIGIVGHGRIGSTIRERIAATEHLETAYVFTREPTDVPDDVPLLFSPEDIREVDVDLVVEAATFEAVEPVGRAVLPTTPLLVLSTSALADRETLSALRSVATDAGTDLLVPHGAILGTDGIRDARDVVTSVRMETRKHPDNLDFSFTNGIEPADVDGPTELYRGPTRGICDEFPRNVNAHATVALAGLGFDETESVLVADPSLDTADHRIDVECEGASLAIERSSEIAGVTGGYTIESLWGTIRALCDGPGGLRIV